ncbi:MAG: preprotein translocase subunit SecG [Hyphomicrobiaceae bacterium]|nr:preprotein translocase subunit SecG [Hyphomicrobiaceae bacterium]
MSTVLLIVHIMIAFALIGVVLLQRSEGGALGIGGGAGGVVTGRGVASFLARVTAGLAGAFFVTSLLLSILASHTEGPRSILDVPTGPPARTQPGKPSPDSGGLPQIDLNKIPGGPVSEGQPGGSTEPPRVPQSK